MKKITTLLLSGIVSASFFIGCGANNNMTTPVNPTVTTFSNSVTPSTVSTPVPTPTPTATSTPYSSPYYYPPYGPWHPPVPHLPPML